MSWIWLTLLAVCMQAIRTAGQKQLARQLDALVVSWVRFAFGLPFALLFYVLLIPPEVAYREFPGYFWPYIVIIALAQILATVMLVMLLQRRNFAIGSTLVKSEVVFTAMLGLLLFNEALSVMAVMALILAVSGLLLASSNNLVARLGMARCFDMTSALLGLGAGVLFAVSSVFIRQASLLLSALSNPIAQSVITLVCVLVVQSLSLGLYLWLRRPGDK